MDRIFTTNALQRLSNLVQFIEPIGCEWPEVASNDAEIAITGWGTSSLDAYLLDEMDSLRAIFHTGGSVKGLIPLDAWQRNITVANAASANAVPVAEYCMAMVLLSGKNTLLAANRYHTSTDRSWLTEGYPETGNNGRTIGVVGASRTGRELVRRLVWCDFRVLCSDPHASDHQAASLGITLVSLEELLLKSSIVSLHAPLTPASTGMIGKRELQLMPNGATLINTARAGLVDQEALLLELQAGRLNAVLDVTDPEPLPSQHPLRTLPNVTITPHIAGSVGNELARLGEHTIGQLASYLKGGTPIDAIPLGALAWTA